MDESPSSPSDGHVPASWDSVSFHMLTYDMPTDRNASFFDAATYDHVRTMSLPGMM